jgi:hypothetical protein
MRPSNRYFPTSLAAQAAWFNNWAAGVGNVGASMGLSVAEIASVQADNTIVQFLAMTAVELDAYRSAVQQYRTIITEGKVGDPTPEFPAAIAPTLPTPVPTGIWERVDGFVKRIRVAAAYTDEIGALLGIIPSGSGPVPENEMKPELTPTSLPNSVVQVKFVRGATDGVMIEMSLDNGTWSEAGRYFKSPANLVVPENPEKSPRAVQIRARYVEGDSPVGQFSNIVTTASQPAA